MTSDAFDAIQDLRNGGTLSQSLPGYSERPAQLEMAHVVADALQEKTHAVVEAGTGTGKSLAYLLPIIRSDKKALISTSNKALQEQLFQKDIPFLQHNVKSFTSALVKGFSNYVCLDRLATFSDSIMDDETGEQVKLLAQIEDGDLEKLETAIPIEVKNEVRGDREQCAWKKCTFYEQCHIRKMREQANAAQVVVVNHDLLLLDALSGGKVLPDHDVTIIDEAHHLEEKATAVFTVEMKELSIQTLLKHTTVRDHVKKEMLEKAMKQFGDLWRRLEMLMDEAKGMTLVLTSPIEEGLRLATLVSDIARRLADSGPPLTSEKDDALYAKVVTRTENLSEHLSTVFSVADRKKYVYYLERVTSGDGKRAHIEAKATPLDVAPFLRNFLFGKHPTICTSATLATSTDEKTGLAYFRRRVGLDDPQTKVRILPLVFDYAQAALLYRASTVPEPAYNGPGQGEYQQAIAREMLQLAQASRGRAFLLFSSRRAMDVTYEAIADKIGYPVFKQGDLPNAKLTQAFKQTPNAVLFGLKSFWEGVDIAGDDLSLVVIDKMPFSPPDEPVQQARVNLLKDAGKEWFNSYILAQAILHLKQGVGRLIRTDQDRGVMAILDARLRTKRYGQLVMNALPPARQTASMRQVSLFFAENGAPSPPPDPIAITRCLTTFDRLQEDVHQQGRTIRYDLDGNAWCDRCDIQRMFMDIGQGLNYPTLTYNGIVKVPDGKKNYLRYARIVGHHSLRMALQLLVNQQKESA